MSVDPVKLSNLDWWTARSREVPPQSGLLSTIIQSNGTLLLDLDCGGAYLELAVFQTASKFQSLANAFDGFYSFTPSKSTTSFRFGEVMHKIGEVIHVLNSDHRVRTMQWG